MCNFFESPDVMIIGRLQEETNRWPPKLPPGVQHCEIAVFLQISSCIVFSFRNLQSADFFHAKPVISYGMTGFLYILTAPDRNQLAHIIRIFLLKHEVIDVIKRDEALRLIGMPVQNFGIFKI